ncbi:hypothetical protein OS493_000353 [Desmophyllum pertusum]|uniref:Uncharacterized protein n=1 Tax=Desmophyllum pertusum TaxID=174260 RepID=A0A9X0A7F1_9CNID|nr:hypothetical protein OS493_000353 [Desmophyllum pertusum]
MDVFGDEEVATVVKHYEETLLRVGVDVESVELEWTLLKNDMQSTRGRRPFFKDAEKPQRHPDPPVLDIPTETPAGAAVSEAEDTEDPTPAAEAEDIEVLVDIPTPTDESEEIEVEEQEDDQEEAAVREKEIENDDSGDSGLESEGDDDEETVLKRLMQF